MRRYLQFRLRTLFAVTALVAVACLIVRISWDEPAILCQRLASLGTVITLAWLVISIINPSERETPLPPPESP